MEIVRKDELEHLLDAINENPYGKFIISGIAGSGKTFLLNVLGTYYKIVAKTSFMEERSHFLKYM